MRFTAFALLALTLTAAPAAAQRQTETVDRTVPIGPRGTLKLDNFSGDVTITWTSGTDVIIHAVRRATRERLENIKLDIRVDGSTVTIEANKRNRDWHETNNNVVDTEFEIQVPYETNLDLDAFSSSLRVREVAGSITAETFSGKIELDVSRASDTPKIDAESFSGNIVVRVPPAGNGRVRFESFSGELDTDLPLTFQGRSNRRNVNATFGGGSGEVINVKTFSGDVKLLK